MRYPIDLDAFLAQSASRSTPLWLALSRAQAERQTPRGLLGRFTQEPICAPSPFDQRELTRLDHHALEAARDYEALLLGPVAPLGSCSVVAPTSQDRTLSASRGLEIVSLPALERTRYTFDKVYYDGVRVMLGVRRGDEVQWLSDTGRFDWMGTLTSNRKMRFVASGLGIAQVARFGVGPEDARHQDQRSQVGQASRARRIGQATSDAVTDHGEPP